MLSENNGDYIIGLYRYPNNLATSSYQRPLLSTNLAI